MERLFSGIWPGRSWWMFGLLFALTLCAGCQETVSTPAPEGAGPPAPTAVSEDSSPLGVEQADESTAAEGELLQESWYAFYSGQDKFGHAHTTVRAIDQSGRKIIETRTHQELTIPRQSDQVTQQVELITRETESGQVIELQSMMQDGHGRPVTTQGRVDAGKLKLTLRAHGRSAQDTIGWNSDIGGFNAEQASLERDPLRPGESRKLQALIPLLNVIGEIHLAAKQWEEVPTPLGTERLLRIEATTKTDDFVLDSVYWTDAEGVVRKQTISGANLTVIRTSKALALAPNASIDLFQAIQVKVAKPLSDPHHSQRAVYRARLKSGKDPLPLFAEGLSQQVRSVDASWIEIEVRQIRPDQPAEVSGETKHPGEGDLAANAMIEHDAPEIRQLAADVAPDVGEAWPWAVACESFVNRYIDKKGLSEAFRTAAEVAQLRQGDCTEHAVLLAALCRAHGLPARVATGLIAYRDVYAFHMWTEVWIDDRWIPLDATLGLGGIGAGHIKMSDSDLAGVSPFTALVPVLDVIGQLELEVIAAR